jgi:rhamnosyltransferase
MYTAARMLMKDYHVIYAGNAAVRHSHEYSVMQEFRRHFDIGAFHSEHTWIMQTFGKAGGEGKRFVISELKYLLSQGKPHLIPMAVVRTAAKLVGYKLGLKAHQMSQEQKVRYSMNKHYWQ